MIKFLQKWSLGWLGVYLYARRSGRRFIDIDIIDRVMHSILYNRRLEPFDEDEHKLYASITSTTSLWHGTGLYQYRDGSLINSFDETISQKSLRPDKDVFDITIGEMKSVSTAHQRMYARIYADMHEYLGANPHDRYGKPYFWGYFFIVSSALIAVHKLNLWHNIRKRHRIARDVRTSAESTWSRKVTTRPFSSWKNFFTDGSDIKGNCGILIGIGGKHTKHTTSTYISMYETRLAENIGVENWTHIEVASSHIDQIKQLLSKRGIDIPVFAIEGCEAYWSERRFSELIGLRKQL